MGTRKSKSKPTPARLAIFAAGRSVTEFARSHGTSKQWVSSVLRGRASPTARFRRDLSEFLDLPETELFPIRGGPDAS